MSIKNTKKGDFVGSSPSKKQSILQAVYSKPKFELGYKKALIKIKSIRYCRKKEVFGICFMGLKGENADRKEQN